jgi:hypothetical protein
MTVAYLITVIATAALHNYMLIVKLSFVLCLMRMGIFQGWMRLGMNLIGQSSGGMGMEIKLAGTDED